MDEKSTYKLSRPDQIPALENAYQWRLEKR